MKGSITSKEERTDGNIVLFEVNENDYRPEVARILNRKQSIGGEILVTDWGYPESNRRISVSNFYVDEEDYEKLLSIKEDDDNIFHFHYKNTTWQVIVQRVEGFPRGNLRSVSMYLQVVSKIADGEIS